MATPAHAKQPGARARDLGCIASAIVLDVTVVRALLVPAAMKLLGRAAWWAPKAFGGR